MPASRFSSSHRFAAFAPLSALLAGVLLLAPARAQQPLSAPIGGSLSDPIYVQSNQTGPSSTLFEGDNNIQTPYIRTGVSDPLSYLIESGFMSPYVAGTELGASYADAVVQSQLMTDSTVTERFSEYRDNRALMGGAGGPSTLASHAATAGSLGAHTSGAAAPGAAAAAFSSVAIRSPFAAGSLATRQAAIAAGSNGFLDPNALVMAANSSSALASGQPMASSTDVPGAGAGSMIFAADATGTISDVLATAAGGAPGEIVVPPANGTVAGPAAGEIFPDVAMVMPSSTGFPDSTMGTAAPAFQMLDTGISPLSSSRASSDTEPFRALNSPNSRFLNPSLVGIAGNAPGGVTSMSGMPTATSFSEVRRKARLHAMIYNPDAPMPSPFQVRAMERAYQKQNSGRHVPHRPKLTSDSQGRP